MSSTTLIPVQPLVDYIENLGGPHALPGMGVEQQVEDPTAKGPTHVTVRSMREGHRLVRLRSRLRSARLRGGLIDLYIADDTCIEFLGVHPCMVYGMDWFDYLPDETAVDADVRMDGEILVLGVAA